MTLSRTQIIIGVAAIALVGIVWGGQFYWQNLRGIGPAIRPAASPPSESMIPPPPGTSTNTTGLPLSLKAGFSISTIANNVPGARAMVFDKLGNLWVSQTKEGVVRLLTIKDGVVTHQENIFKNLRKPHGLAFDPEDPLMLYIAEENKVSRVRVYSEGTLEKIIDLPIEGNHFTRTIGFGPDGRLYISVGSTCNVCNETDWRRAKMLVANRDGTGLREYAKGLRNSVFFRWHPQTKELWATEMGRDLLGDDLPPDEINIVKENQNYGWPTCYGNNVHDGEFDKNTYIRNPCMLPFEQPSLIDLQAHSAPLGLTFVPSNSNWPAEYRNNLLVAYHGSWNRTVPTGYKVVWFSKEGDGYTQSDFITGFFPAGGSGTDAALGRPADLIFGPDKNLYISDDKAGAIYKVSYSAVAAKASPSPVAQDGCKVGGCSGELCYDPAQGEGVSICIWREEFSCYKSAKCERQANGQCGWTQTTELKQCLGS